MVQEHQNLTSLEPIDISNKEKHVTDTEMEEFSLLQEFKGRSFECAKGTLFESIVFSRASGEVTLCTNDKVLFNSQPYVFFFALRTEDVENSLAVVCSSTDDTPALVPLRQVVLNEQEDEIEDEKFLVMKQVVNKFLKARLFHSEGNEADLSLITNVNEDEENRGGNSREINKCGGDHQKDLGKRKTRGISKPKERFSPDLKSQKRICDETLRSKTRAKKQRQKKQNSKNVAETPSCKKALHPEVDPSPHSAKKSTKHKTSTKVKQEGGNLEAKLDCVLNALGGMQAQIDELKANSDNSISNQSAGISMSQNPLQMIPGLPSLAHGSVAGGAQQGASEGSEVLQNSVGKKIHSNL